MSNPDLTPKHGIDVNGHAYTRMAKPEGAGAGSLGGRGGAAVPPPAAAWQDEELDAHAIYEATKAKFEGRRFDLSYIDRSDRLSPEQVQTLVDGKNIFEDSAWEDLIGAMDEQAYDGAQRELKEMLSEDELEQLRDADLDGDLRQAILDRESGSWLDQIRGNTPSMLFRYETGLEFDAAVPNRNDTDAEVERRARQVAEVLGADYDDPKTGSTCRELIAESLYSGGKLEIIWYGDVDEAVDLAQGPEEQAPTDPVTPTVGSFGLVDQPSGPYAHPWKPTKYRAGALALNEARIALDSMEEKDLPGYEVDQSSITVTDPEWAKFHLDGLRSIAEDNSGEPGEDGRTARARHKALRALMDRITGDQREQAAQASGGGDALSFHDFHGEDGQSQREVGTLSIGKAHVLVRNANSGSGGEVELDKVSLPWVTGRVSTDVAGSGYSWTDTAGPYEPAYRSDITATKR